MFCVGGDLQDIAASESRSAHLASIADAVHSGILALNEAPVPVVTAVAGTAAGGGIGVALAGDLVLAAQSVKFALAYTAAGLSPDCGTSWHLTRRLGEARTLDLALTNRRFTAVEAVEAVEWGLISRMVADEDLVAETESLATALATGPGSAFAQTKRLVRAADVATLENHLRDEARTISELVDTADGREGIDAFLAKRPPAFHS